MSSKLVVNTIAPRTNSSVDIGGLNPPTFNGDPLITFGEVASSIENAVAAINPVLSYSGATPYIGSSDIESGLSLKWGRVLIPNSSGTHTFVIAFPQNFLKAIFSVHLSLQTGALTLDSLNYAVYNPSSNGFTLVVVRSGTTSATTYVNWVAYGKN